MFSKVCTLRAMVLMAITAVLSACSSSTQVAKPTPSPKPIQHVAQTYRGLRRPAHVGFLPQLGESKGDVSPRLAPHAAKLVFNRDTMSPNLYVLAADGQELMVWVGYRRYMDGERYVSAVNYYAGNGMTGKLTPSVVSDLERYYVPSDAVKTPAISLGAMQQKDGQEDPGETAMFFVSHSLGKQVATAMHYDLDKSKWRSGACTAANPPGIMEEYQERRNGELRGINFSSDYIDYCFNGMTDLDR